jgi:hypothetical protein
MVRRCAVLVLCVKWVARLPCRRVTARRKDRKYILYNVASRHMSGLASPDCSAVAVAASHNVAAVLTFLTATPCQLDYCILRYEDRIQVRDTDSQC